MTEQKEQADLVIIVDRVLDGSQSSQPRMAAGVAIANGRILEVGEGRLLRVRRPDVPVAEYAGATLLPGLIDSHVHLTLAGDGTPFEEMMPATPEVLRARIMGNARAHLVAGVTTVRDVGSPADLLVWRADLGPDLPRILACGPPLTPPRGHLYPMGGECAGIGEIAARVRANIALGADGIKVMASGGGTVGTMPHRPSFSFTELGEAVRVAHEMGRPVTAHALASRSVEQALDAGVDGIEHVAFLDESGTSRLAPDLTARLVERQVRVCPALAVNLRYLALAEKGLAPGEAVETQRIQSQYSLENAATLYQEGAYFVAGSDAGWKYTAFGDFASELERMVLAGMCPRAVISSATATAAEYLGLGSLGRIAPGFVADLLIVEGDPEADIGALRQVRAVYKDGQRVT